MDGRKLMEDVYKDNAMALNNLAWGVVDPARVKDKKPDAKMLRLALDAAVKANDMLQGKDANTLDTLAQAHFLSGNVAQAVELQEKAVKLSPDSEEMKQRLETFKKALDKK